jgi:hypothetical protein
MNLEQMLLNTLQMPSRIERYNQTMAAFWQLVLVACDRDDYKALFEQMKPSKFGMGDGTFDSRVHMLAIAKKSVELLEKIQPKPGEKPKECPVRARGEVCEECDRDDAFMARFKTKTNKEKASQTEPTLNVNGQKMTLGEAHDYLKKMHEKVLS